MNEPTPASDFLESANSHLEARNVPVRFEVLTYINRDHETFIGLTDPVSKDDLAKHHFKPMPSNGAVSIAVRGGKDPWTIAWRSSQTDQILCCAVEGQPTEPIVQKMLAKLE